MARPSIYTQWKARAICMRLMDGESLRSICGIKGYPSRRTVLYWLTSNDEFLRQYTQAREIQQELLYEEMFEIADDASNDWMEKQDREGSNIGWKENGDSVNRSRLRIDARKWAMERMAPKKYNPKQKIEHTGNVTYGHLTDEELRSRIDSLMEAVK